MVGKPNESIPAAPIKPIPVFSTPFEKIVVDCVGPLPKTKKGNQFLLTVMDTSTRYPEAFPLKSITSKNVIKHLLHLFTSVGIPKEIQSDQGTNFTSNLFKQVMKDLSVDHCTSMLKKYCIEHQKEWDESIDLLLFAIRECPQESLGFSPFELLYGRQIRGPLKIVKEQWFDTPSIKLATVSQYIDTLRDKLTEVRTIAQSNLKKVQEKMVKSQPKLVKRSFSPGDKVLLFLPIPGSPLKSKFTGPYIVANKLSPLNYIVHTPDRRKDSQLVHINLMKLYHSRQSEEDIPEAISQPVLHTVLSGPEPETDDMDLLENLDFPLPKENPTNSHILNNLDEYFSVLNPSQAKDLTKLLSTFPKVTSDLPGFCNILKHDIKLISDDVQPIRQSAYRLNPQKKKRL